MVVSVVAEVLVIDLVAMPQGLTNRSVKDAPHHRLDIDKASLRDVPVVTIIQNAVVDF